MQTLPVLQIPVGIVRKPHGTSNANETNKSQTDVILDLNEQTHEGTNIGRTSKLFNVKSRFSLLGKLAQSFIIVSHGNADP